MEDIEKVVRKVRYKADQQRFGNYPTVTLSVGTVYALCDESASLLSENERLRSTCYPKDGVEAIIRERDAYKAELAAERAKTKKLVDITADMLLARDRLQSQLAEEVSRRYQAECNYDAWKKQALEAQRRERAAVEDIMCRDHCDVCVSGKERDGECKAANYDCQTCRSATCRCRECRDENKWQWRGPGAEEGDNNGAE